MAGTRTVVAGALCWLFMAAPSRAGTIQIQMQVSSTSHAGGVTVDFRVTNTGDEAAREVVPRVRFGRFEGAGLARPTLAPGGSFAAKVEVASPGQGPGAWPLTATAEYADAAGHGFEALAVNLVTVGRASPSGIAVVDVEVQEVRQSAPVHVRLKSLSDVTRRAEIRLVVPRGLDVQPAVQPLVLEPWGEARPAANIVNREAPVGSRFPVFVTVEYDDEAGHHTALAQATVEMAAARFSAGHALLGMALVLGAAWFAALAYGRIKSRPAGARAGDPPH